MEAAPAPSPFPATRWSCIVALRSGSDPTLARAALATLCRDYWEPLYLFARRQGESAEDAKDLTQGFFAYILERELFAAADPQLGRLRSFLLKVFQGFLQDGRKREQAQKRGGGREIISLDAAEEEQPGSEPAAAGTPETEFERHWAYASLRAALRRLEAEEDAAACGAQFRELQPFLQAELSAEPRYADAAMRLGQTETAVRQAVSRLRKRFRVHLRQ
jgi:RNA polymerase sigma-70 factor (ECF subfamily)